MTGIFISHTSGDDEKTHAFVEHLRASLQEAGHTVFLDRHSLHVADMWRPAVFRELAVCEGAVLVLSTEALRSDWVLLEASILTWRRAMRVSRGGSLPIAALLVDGVKKEDVTARFSPLALDDAQLLTVDMGTSASAKNAVKRVVDRFRGLSKSAEDPMQVWVSNVAAWLKHVEPNWQAKMAAWLAIPDEDWQLDGQSQILAYAMLHADLAAAYNALEEVIVSGSQYRSRIVQYVLPVGVSPEVSRAVLQGLSRPHGQRVVIVNANYHETAELLIKRATCCDGHFIVIPPVPPSGTTTSAIVDDIVAAIAKPMGLRDPGRLDDNMLATYPKQIVVLLQKSAGGGTGLTLRSVGSVLSELRRRLGSVLCVVVAGSEDFEATDPGFAGAITVNPRLEQDEEDRLDMRVREFQHLLEQ